VSCAKDFTEMFLPHVDEWIDWAEKINTHPLVIQTIKNRPESLFHTNTKGCASYKHWFTLSDDLYERGSEFVLEKLFVDKYKNWIGEDAVCFVREEYKNNQ